VDHKLSPTSRCYSVDSRGQYTERIISFWFA
jgi:hypothetical protein